MSRQKDLAANVVKNSTNEDGKREGRDILRGDLFGIAIVVPLAVVHLVAVSIFLAQHSP